MNFGIIAAGEGSRLQQEGSAVSKPLVRLDGEPMIGRLLRLMASCGAQRVALVLNPSMPEVEEYVRGLQPELCLDLDITVKATPSSMHSFYEISRSLKGGGRFIATTVDTVFRADAFRRYVEQWRQADPHIEGMMAMTQYIDDEKPLYIAAGGDNSRIEAFLDTPLPDTRYVSGGIYGLGERAIEVLEDCMLQGVSRMRNYQRALLAAGLTVYGHDMGKILDVDHIGDIVKAEQFLHGTAVTPK